MRKRNKMNEYKRIGDLVDLIDERNKDDKVKTLIGVSIDKCFIKSVANTIGTDLSKYQVVRKFDFACSLMQVSRDGKIPIACLKDYDEAIRSPAYYIFRIKNTEEILPDYMAMWFMRPEFDREASYIAVGGVRGSMPWEDFCDMKLPVPDIKEQQKIVDTYNVITNRIRIKQKINENLEKTAQCLFEEMYSKNTTKKALGELVEFVDGDRGSNYPTASEFFDKGYCLFLNASNVTDKGFNFDNCQFITEDKDKKLRKGHLSNNDIVLTSRGTIGNVALFTNKIPFTNMRINSGMLIIRPKNEIPVYTLYALLRSNFMKKAIDRFKSGSAQPQLPIRDLEKMEFLVPIQANCFKDEKHFKVIYDESINNFNEITRLTELRNVVISQISKR